MGRVIELIKGIKPINGVLIFIAIILISVIVNVITSEVSNTPTGAVEKLINYSSEAKWEKSEELIASRMKQFLKSENATENLRNSMGKLVYDENGAGRLDKFELEEAEFFEDELSYADIYSPNEEFGETEAATVYANLTFDNERVTRSWEFDMVKENGDWKVLAYRLR